MGACGRASGRPAAHARPIGCRGADGHRDDVNAATRAPRARSCTRAFDLADAPTQTPQRHDTAPETVTVTLPPVDVRRKRPPALAFLLRLETLRKALRVASLLVLDVAGVCAAIYVALMVKAVLRYGDWAWHASYD